MLFQSIVYHRGCWLRLNTHTHTHLHSASKTHTHTYRLKNRHQNKIKTQNPLLACSVWCIGLFSIISLRLLLISYTHAHRHEHAMHRQAHTQTHTHGTAFPGTEEERLILLCCRKIPRNPSTRHDATALMTRCPDPDQTPHTPQNTVCVCCL